MKVGKYFSLFHLKVLCMNPDRKQKTYCTLALRSSFFQNQLLCKHSHQRPQAFLCASTPPPPPPPTCFLCCVKRDFLQMNHSQSFSPFYLSVLFYIHISFHGICFCSNIKVKVK